MLRYENCKVVKILKTIDKLVYDPAITFFVGEKCDS